MYDILVNTFLWFKKAVPEPNEQNISTQMGVHFEEVAEMVAEIVPADMDTNAALLDAKVALQHLADRLKKNPGCVTVPYENREGYLDALCDQIVTATGCARMIELDIVGGMTEVNRSNFSKFDNGTPLFDENMKVRKGPNYSKADLTPYI